MLIGRTVALAARARQASARRTAAAASLSAESANSVR